jgi:hypothetical protein
MAIVLVALTMLSILGAVMLLLLGFLASSAQGVGPSRRAFSIADSALALAHRAIVDGQVPDSGDLVLEGELFGGNYRVVVCKKPGTSMDYIVSSQGSCRVGGREYRRKIREEVSYAGEKAFDVMKNYLIYAGKKLTIRYKPLGQFIANTDFYGSLGGAEGVDVILDLGFISLLNFDSFGIHGDVDSYRSVSLYYDVGTQFLGTPVMEVNGSVRTGNIDYGIDGSVSLSVGGRSYLGGNPTLKVATSRGQSIYTASLSRRTWGDGRIQAGPVVSQRGAPRVYIPKPNYGYYRALAEGQGNILTTNRLSGELGSRGRSGLTVLYYPRSDTLYLDGFIWNQPDAKGVIVSEGNIVVRQSLALFEGVDLKLIAKGNIVFDDRVEFSIAATNRITMWAGGDAVFDNGFFKGQYCQITALGNVLVKDGGLVADWSNIRYYAPDIDVCGFTVDLEVKNWREVEPD